MGEAQLQGIFTAGDLECWSLGRAWLVRILHIEGARRPLLPSAFVDSGVGHRRLLPSAAGLADMWAS